MRTILRLTVKELRAIARDVVMLVLTAYVFTVATYMVSDAISTDVDHLAIAVVDEGEAGDQRAQLQPLLAGVPQVLWLHNKSDLFDAAEAPVDAIAVSARNGEGLDALRARLVQLAGRQGDEGAFSARARHVEALQRTREHLSTAGSAFDHGQLELAAEDLRLGHDALGEITGRLLADDLLGHIFTSFCIGK